MGGGSWLMTICMIMLGPPAWLLVISCGVDMGPLAMAMPKNGSGFAPAMGLDGAVWRSGSKWYGSKSESKAVWPFDGVRGHREWSRRCRFNVLNCGCSPLTHKEERGGSIVLYLCINLVGMIFWTPVSMASYWLSVVTWPPRLPEDNAWIFPHTCFYSIGRVIVFFTW